MRAEPESLCGVVLVNKPKNCTSFDVCGKLRGILGTRRIGHTGTLDPMAEGVLPVLVGKAAKACDILPEDKKEYKAGFKLGISTDTQDITGSVLDRDETPVDKAALRLALEGFKGKYMQTPPMYSAVKVGGRKLYEYAREGRQIEREPKERYVHYISLEEYDEQTREGSLTLSVSKGTYIRTLIDDAARSIGTHGVMTSLVRTKACGFDIGQCRTIDEIQALADRDELQSVIIGLDKIFDCYEKIQLDERKAKMYKNGVKLRPEQLGIKEYDGHSRFCIMSGGELISVAYIDVTKNEVRSLRNFY
ncbi:MAG: tRNA pseudouridine(55) synthase TruB [Ruminococcus sp.]|nr:tRNA pseudouridine(55) synthase TruB [Ruminococcus sp.]